MKDKLIQYIDKQETLNKHFIIEAINNNVNELIESNIIGSKDIINLITKGE